MAAVTAAVSAQPNDIIVMAAGDFDGAVRSMCVRGKLRCGDMFFAAQRAGTCPTDGGGALGEPWFVL